MRAKVSAIAVLTEGPDIKLINSNQKIIVIDENEKK